MGEVGKPPLPSANAGSGLDYNDNPHYAATHRIASVVGIIIKAHRATAASSTKHKSPQIDNEAAPILWQSAGGGASLFAGRRSGAARRLAAW